jgi:hypothetical protein
MSGGGRAAADRHGRRRAPGRRHRQRHRVSPARSLPLSFARPLRPASTARDLRVFIRSVLYVVCTHDCRSIGFMNFPVDIAVQLPLFYLSMSGAVRICISLRASSVHAFFI